MWVILPYAGQSPLPNQRSHSGILFDGVNNPIDISMNTFDNLNFGAIIQNSTLDLNNNIFTNITKVSNGAGLGLGYNGPSDEGQAVYVEKSTVNITNSVFNAVHTGIRYKNAFGEIEFNQIANSFRGIFTGGNWNGDGEILIKDNVVGASRFGIHAALNQHIIKGNNVTIQDESVNGIVDNAVGIRAGAFSPSSEVLDNNVTMINGKTGIYLPFTNGQNVKSNRVALAFGNKPNVVNDQIAIHREGGNSGTMNCNRTSGNGRAGIYMMHTSAPTVSCNTTSDAHDGFFLDGVSVGAANMNFKGNTMENNIDVGLRLGAGSAIGQQSHRGNIFSGVSAVHDGGAFGASASPFFVDVSENPLFMPGFVQPPNWFLDQPFLGESYQCGNTTLCLSTPDGDPPGGYGEMAIARGQLQLDAYQAAGLWLAQRRLTEKILLEGNPQPDEPDMVQFIDESLTNGLAAFAEIQVALRDMPIGAEEVNALLAVNSEIVAVYPYEQTENRINEIVLKTIALGNPEFTDEQMTALVDIANRCPLSDGEAVLRARALLVLTDNEALYFNNEYLCENVENRAATNGRMVSCNYINIYPNPASNDCRVEFYIQSQSSGIVNLYNTVGVIVKSIPLEGERGRISIDISDLKEGSYWYHIPDAASRISSGRLLIQR